eukprot:jgi/Orpsp1_1/1190520/evm.model.d7180000079523.1
MVNKLVDSTIQAFRKQFGEEPDAIFMSPGRINVIGEHIDYNNGFVLPAAIDKYICFAIKKLADSELGEFYAADYDDKYTVNINDELKPVSQMWANYMLGVIHQIKKQGKKFGGFKVALSSDIPIGAGLSSSAALECGFAYALDTIYELGISRKEITIIGQTSEHTFAGVNCGIMDQFASVFGKEEKVIKLDCNTLEYSYFDAKLGDYCFVLFDTCVKHTLATSGYNDRRNEVESGIKMIKSRYSEVKDFRDVTHDMLENLKGDLGDVVYRRCRFVIEEIKRVEEAALALQSQDIKKLGELLNATHHGLSKEYEVSCKELDFLVDEVLKQNGVSGARMMGGGFGGCTINLVKKSEADNIIATIQKKYKEAFGIDMKVYQVNISEGTHQYEEKQKVAFNISDHPHRRYNPLLDQWVLVSPQRAKRPWMGQKEKLNEEKRPQHDKSCYLCPGNTRVNGDKNPDYRGPYVFRNDFPALLSEEVSFEQNDQDDLFKINPERGINRVICFSDDHSLTLPIMKTEDIEKVVTVWQEEYKSLGAMDYINHVQIFENKGSVMGCSNPHPHCQIWAQSSLPTQVAITQKNLKKYYDKNGRTLLEDYLKKELEKSERIVLENESFVVLVPFWATWPYETMIISKRHIKNILEFTGEEKKLFAAILKEITIKYDNLFETSFPYSAGIHQAPTDGEDHPEWHFHMHFYPPLLRSATVKKFMVGYEMMGEAQRDITPEQSAAILRKLSSVHYKSN